MKNVQWEIDLGTPNAMKIFSILLLIFHFIGLAYESPYAFNHYNPYMGIFLYFQNALMLIYFGWYTYALFSDKKLAELKTDESEEKEEKEVIRVREIGKIFALNQVLILDAGIMLGTIIFLIVTKFVII